MPSIPASRDLAENLRPLLTFHTSPASTTNPRNILVLLHGLGDTSAPFLNVARQLNLPSTAYLVIRGPAPLPFDLGGFHWADDIQFSQAGVLDPDSGFQKAARLLANDVITGLLVSTCKFEYRDIHLLGLGQGGMAAMAALVHDKLAEKELGGAVTLGGTLPEQCKTVHGKSKTPILLCHGSMKSAVTTGRVKDVKDKFNSVQVVEWKGKVGDGMPTNQAEMTPLMRFWATRLRAGLPPGTVEVG